MQQLIFYFILVQCYLANYCLQFVLFFFLKVRNSDVNITGKSVQTSGKNNCFWFSIMTVEQGAFANVLLFVYFSSREGCVVASIPSSQTIFCLLQISSSERYSCLWKRLLLTSHPLARLDCNLHSGNGAPGGRHVIILLHNSQTGVCLLSVVCRYLICVILT